RSRGVGVVFQEFRRVAAVETQIEPAIEAGIVAMPALRDQRPEGLRYLQPAQVFFIVDRVADQFEAHRVDLAGRLLDPPLDLLQRECVIGPFVPIALAVDGVEIEPGAFGGGAPVVAFRAGDALHDATIALSREVGTGLRQENASKRKLAAAMGVAAVTVAMELMRRSAADAHTPARKRA